MINLDSETIENRIFKAIEDIGELREITVKELYENFPKLNKKTISWSLHNLVQKNKLYKTGYGVYSLNNSIDSYSMGYEYLSLRGKGVYDLLMDYGYKYYITGIDALSGELLHVTENHPVIIVAEEAGIRDIQEILINQSMIVITESERKKYKEMMYYENYQVLIIKGKKFDFDQDAIAIKEKAFIDLYYAVTRMDYSLSVQELFRIYGNLYRKGYLKRRMMIQGARDRGILNEIQLIIDSKKLTDESKQFLRMTLDEAE